MHVAIVTAGGAGMYCGSCMHDNTWARALMAAGVEVSLIPTYTPIRVDEQDVSQHDVLLGGINVYLDQRLPLWSKLPRALTSWLNAPWVLRLASRFGVSNNAAKLGDLTIAMLSGELGPQRREVQEFAEFFSSRLRPDVICYSNALLVGTLKTLRQNFHGKVFCVLQGDDIFLDALPEDYRQRAIELIQTRSAEFDGFITHSNYYADYMSEYLKLPRDRFFRLPLGIDLDGHDGRPEPRRNPVFTVGYFARICPEKGLQNLVDGFRVFHSRHPNSRLMAGGYLFDSTYLEQVQHSAADLENAFQYIGSPDSREKKVAFMKSLDVLSVPTGYHEPKGIYVLEALANGTPVVQPAHGAFPELITSTGGGLLVESTNPEVLANALEALRANEQLRTQYAVSGHEAVHRNYGATAIAQASIDLFGSDLGKRPD